MCVNIYKLILLFCICLNGVLWTACSGNTDETGQRELTLSVDKNTLKADGKDAVNFVVRQAGADVTSDAVIRCMTKGENLTGTTFSTVEPGKYVFEASYDGQVSGQITVSAEEIAAKTSKFVRRICAMEFTGTWCAMCPGGLTRLNYLINSSYEGIVYMMAFHVNGSPSDPMVIEQSSVLSNKFGLSAYPSCVVDMRGKMALSENYTVMRSVFNESLDNYPAHCGVAIQSEYNGQATVTVRVTSERNSEYRLIVYAVEDGVKHQQNDGGIYRDYMHNHVVRRLLSATVDGDKLGQIAVGEEISKYYTFTADEGWDVDNLSFYALVTDENGYVNNLAVCAAVDGYADYEYVND